MCEDWMAECPCCSMALNVLAVIALVITIIFAANDTAYNRYNSLISPRDLVYIPFVLFLLVYILYLVECYFASTRKYLKNIYHGKTLHNYVSEVKDASPVVTLKTSAWHFETKTRSVCYTDARGKRKWRNEKYQEKVVTSSENEPFSFIKWKDGTTVPVEIENSSVVVLVCSKSFRFADEYSKQMFMNQSCALQARNRHRDAHMDYEEELQIEGFMEQILAFTDLNKRRWWIKSEWYWICSIFLLSWPFRIMLKKHCCFTSIEFVKEIQINPV